MGKTKTLFPAVTAALAVLLSSSAKAHCLEDLVANKGAAVALSRTDLRGLQAKIRDYNDFCARLNRANATLDIFADSAVLDNRTVAWAMATVRDVNLPIGTKASGGVSTRLLPSVGRDKAGELMLEAIVAAINTIGVDAAIADLEAVRRTVGNTYRPR